MYTDMDCCCLVAKSCLTLCNPMDSSLPGSSVPGISQARILEWGAIPSPGDLPHPWIEPASPALAGRFFTTEPPGKPYRQGYIPPFHTLFHYGLSQDIEYSSLGYIAVAVLSS